MKDPVAPQIGTPVVNPDGEKPPSTVVKGMLLMSFAMLVLPIMDGIAKVLSTHYDVTAAQITFGRFLVQASLFALIIPVFLGIKFLLARHWLVNLIRGAN